jgi:hypothetical protein
MMKLRTLLACFAVASTTTLCSLGTAKAEDWSTSTKILATSAMVLTVADWGQTRDIVKSNGQYIELNRILGPRPSMSAVNTYFVATLATQYIVAEFLPDPYKTMVLSGMLGISLQAVGNNKSIGLKINFGL